MKEAKETTAIATFPANTLSEIMLKGVVTSFRKAGLTFGDYREVTDALVGYGIPRNDIEVLDMATFVDAYNNNGLADELDVVEVTIKEEWKTWEYHFSTNTIWTNFDYGTVEARNEKEAYELSEKDFQRQLDEVNAILKAHANGENGYEIEASIDELSVSLSEN